MSLNVLDLFEIQQKLCLFINVMLPGINRVKYHQVSVVVHNKYYIYILINSFVIN